MTNLEKLQQFTQDVYRIRYNRFVDNIADADGLVEVQKTIGWANDLLDELELEADWQWVRENDKSVGIISSATQTFDLPDDARKLVVSEYRPLAILQDGAIVSLWDVVDPNQGIRRDRATRDKRVTVVNNQIVFSQPLDTTEIGGTIIADVINSIPRLADNNTEALDLVKPISLLKLGAAKNATLPDIVQGGLSPSFVQKYADLLAKAVGENNASAEADEVERDDYSGIGGVW